MHSVQRGYVISGSKEGSYPLHWFCLVFLRMRDRRIRNTGREINDVRPKFLIHWLRRLCFFLLKSSTSVEHGVVLQCIRSDILRPLPRTQTSLSRWKCARKGRREGDSTLPMVPCGSSPVAPLLCEKRSAWGGSCLALVTVKCRG